MWWEYSVTLKQKRGCPDISLWDVTPFWSKVTICASPQMRFYEWWVLLPLATYMFHSASRLNIHKIWALTHNKSAASESHTQCSAIHTHNYTTTNSHSFTISSIEGPKCLPVSRIIFKIRPFCLQRIWSLFPAEFIINTPPELFPGTKLAWTGTRSDINL
jgi:uncharacterized paraquat-inducible protein A